MNIIKSIFKICLYCTLLVIITAFVIPSIDNLIPIIKEAYISDIKFSHVILAAWCLALIIITIVLVLYFSFLILLSIIDIVICNDDVLNIVKSWKSSFNKGDTGPVGPMGPRGKSIYEIWLEFDENEGKTEEEFMDDMAKRMANFKNNEQEENK